MKQTIAAGLLVAALALALAAFDPGFFVKDDFQLEFLPASYEISRAFADGEFPLLTRASWMCAALAAEYQFGVFSIFRMLLEALAWLLPLSLTARGVLLFVVHAAIAGAGGFALARSYGVRPAYALMVAVIAGLNGWILWWGTTWYAITASWAWLPWYWVGLRRGSVIGTALALYLLVTGGAPYVVAMAAFVALVNLPSRNRLAMIGASALGLALAAPAVLMLLEYFPATARSNAAARFEDLWTVPPLALLGLPAQWNTFRGSVTRMPVEMLGALVPLVAVLWSAATAVAALVRRDPQRQLRWRTPHLIAALFVLLALLLLPSAGPFRWSFRWLPLFHLVIALLGAIALPHLKRAWLPAALTIAMIATGFIAFHDRDEVSRFAIETRTTLDPARRYLALYDLDAMQHAALLPGNTPMLAHRRFINGYSPMGLAALNDIFQFDVHGSVPPAHAEQLLRHESGRNQLLHHLGVDGLIVPAALVQRNAALLSRNGWRPAARIANCFVLHRDPLADPLFAAALATKVAREEDAYAAIFERRTPQLPVVLLAGGGTERYGRRDITNVVESRNGTSFVVKNRGPKALIVFRRPWLPGWRATIDGRPLPVLRANLLMPAVEIPPDAHGEVRLTYRPRSLTIGTAIAILAAFGIAVIAVRIRRDR